MPRMASGLAPRQEAVPLSWTQLSTDQQQIVRDVHQWLGDLIKNPQPVRSARGGADEERQSQFLPRLEVRRASNVLMIDGGRGTGKTSVFLSLLQFWTDALTADSPSAGTATDAIRDEVVSKVLRERNIIPLDILDMQPLSGRPTLLLQLAGRLYRITERLMQARGDREAAYPRRPEDAAEKSLWRWKDLARAVAIGQVDDPRQRREHSNPEDFTIELEQAERRRMHLSDTWREFIEALRSDVVEYRDRLRPAKPGADPLFIVPIDDADMNPERGVELLELLRSLWHPRVVFLLTGDADLFRTLLSNHYLTVCPKMPPSMARNLAHDVLGKVIPPAQRLVCRVRPNEALKYLKGAAALPPAIIERVERADLNAAFPRRWRVLRDLEQSLNAQRLAPIEAAKVLFEEAVKGAALTDADKDHLLSACFKPARRGKGFRVDENVVTMQPETQQTADIKFDDHRSMSWSLSDGDRWLLRRGSSAAALTADDTADSLPDSITESLYLAASLASEPAPKKEQNKDDAKDKDEIVNVRLGRALSPRDYDLAASTFSFKPVSYKFPWPTPEWVDPVDFYLFLRGWRDALSSQRGALTTFPGATQVSNSQIAAVESLVSWWISAICSLAQGKRIVEDAWQDPGESRWHFLGRSIAKLANSLHPDTPPTVRDLRYVHWARQDALFFSAKLSGLRVATRNQLINGWLAELVRLISGHHKDPDYWMRVNDATQGQVELLERVSSNLHDTSVEQQIAIAIRTISNPSWKILAPKEEKDTSSGQLSVEKFRRAINDSHGEVTPAEELRFSIQALEPESEGRLDDFDLNARLFQFIRSDDERSNIRRTAHFKAQLEICLSQINLASVPYPLSVLDTETGGNLWTRAKNIDLSISWDVTTKLAELAGSSDILARLSKPMAARDAWRAMTVSFLAKRPSLSEEKSITLIDTFLTRTQISPMTFLSLRAGEMHELTETQKIQTPHISVTVRELPDALFIDQGQAAEAAELFVKLHDIVVDETDTQYQSIDEPAWLEHLSVNCVDSSYWLPLPGWPSSVDLLIHVYAAKKSEWLSLVGRPVADPRNWDPWTVFCGFVLNACLAIRARRRQYHILDYVNAISLRLKPEDRDSEFLEQLYRSLSQTVAEANDSRYAGRRARAVREWVNLAGPLFAAPETGMSSDRAARWLRAWDRSPSNTDDPAACKRLSAFRLKRAQASLGSGATATEAQKHLDEIDAKHPKHPWVAVIERRAKAEGSA